MPLMLTRRMQPPFRSSTKASSRTPEAKTAATALPRFLDHRYQDSAVRDGDRHLPEAVPASNTARVPRYLQAKLAVSQPGDPAELAADRSAAEVMRMPQPVARTSGAASASAAENPILRKAVTAVHAERTARANSMLSHAGPGQALDSSTRAYFEPRFGHRFDAVRAHTDTRAAQMNRALDAEAFAYGPDIFFAAGRAPRTDALTAHELAHVVQQSYGNESGLLQRSPDPATPAAEAGAAPPTDTAMLISEATQAIEKAGGKIGFIQAPAEIEGDKIFILFDDLRVHRLFRYLLQHWLGVSGTSESLENAIAPAVPAWVGEFRARALNLRAARAQDPDYAEQRQLADLAVRLADSVATESPAQGIRQRFVEEIDRRIGTTVMTQTDIDAERNKPNTGGLTPKNFTTCIAFFGQVVQGVMQQSGLSTPLLKGPNYYKEIDPVNGKEHLPPGAWRPCTANAHARPKPGDLLIFSFAADETMKSGVFVGKGWFAHISILRAVEPLTDPTPELATGGYTEKFISVDGGGTKAAETVRYFAPDSCLIRGPGNIVRTLKGWIDVEHVAQARLGLQPPASVQG